KKIPNRKLLLLDQLVPSLPGNYGVIYQDFENDAYHALTDNKDLFKKYRKINVITSPNSLYYSLISKGILKFCNENEMNFACFTKFNASDIKADEIYIILNRQLDQELIDILKTIKDKEIVLGKEVGVISYNESPINEFIMNGLTVLSTDFYEMGKWAGEMIKNKSLKKIRNKFELIVRETL
ncbi:MAG TPA: hypothetical protein VL053_19760, partial [Arachidicoccus sp.]|nr:hypothetical protein [Arachidicoccus sp.]